MRLQIQTFTALATMLVLGCGANQTEILTTQVTRMNEQLVQLRKVQAGMSVTIEDLETRLFLLKDEVETAQYRRAGRNAPMRPTLRQTPPTQPAALPTVAVRRPGTPELPVVRLRPTPAQPSAAPPPVVASRPPTAPGVIQYDRLDEDGNIYRGGSATAERPEGQGGPGTDQPPNSTRPAVPASERAAMALYKTSLEHLRQNRYEESLRGFGDFLDKYPTHGYADNAVYWMGECYYARALWVKAMETFQRVIQNYPLGNKVPDAMLKLGLCHLQMRNYRQARSVLQQVAQMFPNSPVAGVATNRLEQIP